MQKNLILLAGYPATGKTYLADLICEKYKGFIKISPDDYKLPLWKKVGFSNLKEKEKLVDEAWEEYYLDLEEAMQNGENIVSEYPFSVKQKHILFEFSQKYQYNITTVRLVAEFETLYERHLDRDVKGKRDIVYNVTSYDPQNPPTDPAVADDIVDKEEFYKRYTSRGYGEFELGNLIEVDTTNFDSINYPKLLLDIGNSIEQ